MDVPSIVLLLIPVVGGVLIGFSAGGRLAGLAHLRLRRMWLLWVAVAFQVAQYYVDGVRRFVEDRLGVPMLALVFATVAVWLAVNVRAAPPAIRFGMVAIMLGALSNGAVILANGRMPYSVTAAADVGMPISTVTEKNLPATPDTRLRFLGDVLPVAPLGKIVSPGDLLISLGAAAVVVAAMRRRVPSRRRGVKNDQLDQLAESAFGDVRHRLDRDVAVHDRSTGD